MNLDIKKVYDSVIRADAREIMRKVGISDDLINLWHMLNYKPRSDLAVGGKIVGSFINKRGIRQGACSSPIIFNAIPMMLERMILEVYPETASDVINSLHFADDTTIIAESLE